MDKLVKRAGVAMLVVVAAAGFAFALGLARFASSLETERVAAPPHPAAALRLPDPMPAPAVETPKQVEVPAVVVVGKPERPQQLTEPPRAAPKKVAARPQPRDPAPLVVSDPPADDMLDLDFGGHEREAKLADRSANAFGVRQLGGAEEKHRTLIPGERVTFETDLASPER